MSSFLVVPLSILVFFQMYSYSLTYLADNKQTQRIVPSIKLVLEIETNVSRKRESCQKLICFLISPLRCNCNLSQYLCILIKKTLEEQGLWFTAPPLLQPLSYILQPLLGPPGFSSKSTGRARISFIPAGWLTTIPFGPNGFWWICWLLCLSDKHIRKAAEFKAHSCHILVTTSTKKDNANIWGTA